MALLYSANCGRERAASTGLSLLLNLELKARGQQRTHGTNHRVRLCLRVKHASLGARHKAIRAD
jgi:hypothetical protein